MLPLNSVWRPLPVRDSGFPGRRGRVQQVNGLQRCNISRHVLRQSCDQRVPRKAETHNTHAESSFTAMTQRNTIGNTSVQLTFCINTTTTPAISQCASLSPRDSTASVLMTLNHIFILHDTIIKFQFRQGQRSAVLSIQPYPDDSDLSRSSFGSSCVM